MGARAEAVGACTVAVEEGSGCGVAVGAAGADVLDNWVIGGNGRVNADDRLVEAGEGAGGDAIARRIRGTLLDWPGRTGGGEFGEGPIRPRLTDMSAVCPTE